VAGITTPNHDAGQRSLLTRLLIRATLATSALRPGQVWRMPPGRQIPPLPCFPTGRRIPGWNVECLLPIGALGLFNWYVSEKGAGHAADREDVSVIVVNQNHHIA
jgi:hypothetical protein